MEGLRIYPRCDAPCHIVPVSRLVGLVALDGAGSSSRILATAVPLSHRGYAHTRNARQ